MEFFVNIAIVSIGLFEVLLWMSLNPRFEKSKVYLLPIICGGLSFGWTVLSIFFIRGRVDSNNFLYLTFNFFVDIISSIGLTAVGVGIITGILLYFGSRLWLRKYKIVSGILVILSLILWVANALATFFALLSWATG
jgi:hypothetical protein